MEAPVPSDGTVDSGHASKDEVQKLTEFAGLGPVIFNHAEWVRDVGVAFDQAHDMLELTSSCGRTLFLVALTWRP